ncbi:diaminobutyrate--2-oxoglutarate transaminase [Pedobacter sp. KACC 23697]|uniref:Diaminobutyrate--2-oxoglutarate transaminase n=1 Tax=Pedobacter sp. KACC 23697 TaxID=3149230 RepID=A0AAU7K4H9_9SPHI
MTNILSELESNVRYYSRSFPVKFDKAKNSYLFDDKGNRYIDFFSGAGALNYGHNPDGMKSKVINYLHADGITHSLDMATSAREKFIREFNRVILSSRNYNYKIQFTGPTGTNAVEAALKLARKFTKRKEIIHFTNSFHGMSMGALSIAGNPNKKRSIGIPVGYTKEIPFNDGTFGIQALKEYLANLSAEELPAAVILETIQADGGINVADTNWLLQLFDLAKNYGIVTIVDDIQVGCGRTGNFFSFEDSGIVPDLICLSKSLSGYGLPMSMLLINPDMDIWEPGEHNGTFRGNNLAFITATEALKYWENKAFIEGISQRAMFIKHFINDNLLDETIAIKGKGLIVGLEFDKGETATEIARIAFKKGLVIEVCGKEDNVIKLLPPLNIGIDDLAEGLDLLMQSILSIKKTSYYESSSL